MSFFYVIKCEVDKTTTIINPYNVNINKPKYFVKIIERDYLKTTIFELDLHSAKKFSSIDEAEAVLKQIYKPESYYSIVKIEN